MKSKFNEAKWEFLPNTPNDDEWAKAIATAQRQMMESLGIPKFLFSNPFANMERDIIAAGCRNGPKRRIRVSAGRESRFDQKAVQR